MFFFSKLDLFCWAQLSHTMKQRYSESTRRLHWGVWQSVIWWTNVHMYSSLTWMPNLPNAFFITITQRVILFFNDTSYTRCKNPLGRLKLVVCFASGFFTNPMRECEKKTHCMKNYTKSNIFEKWPSFYGKLLCVFFVKTKKILRACWRKAYNQF